ncbi:hypothetical protein [Vibrio ulleungensis]|uniref:Lipoprotein n=1 Tax=Vibrio ulleungensis TaxID=2807619 RepID=A0ABS2HK51_9VIBR|nr:hypothetical protein [Vibrio ulleungensis]MBM7036563.1 hypothetical protein [Vibrio ulleungensis]
MRFAVVLISIVFLCGCIVEKQHVQLIDIDVYQSQEKNLALVKELLGYDSSYLISNIEGLSSSNFDAVEIGYDYSLNSSRVSYTVTYSTQSDREIDIPTLKTNFKEFVIRMANFHVDNQKVVTTVSSLVEPIIVGVFLNRNLSDDVVKVVEMKEGIYEASDDIESQLGNYLSNEYLGTHHYINYQGYSWLMVNNYVARFEGGTVILSFGFYESDGAWKVVMFNYYQQSIPE